MALGPGDFVKVSYEGRYVKHKDGTIDYDEESPFNFMWDSRSYPATPGKETFVPYEAMSIALGDPRSGESVASARDESGNVFFVVDRPTELRRLVVLYDNEMADDDITPLYAPVATVTDLEGNEIRTVLDDPLGASVTPVQTTILDRDQLLAQIQRQQRLIEQLADEQGVEIPDEPEEEPEPFDEVPEG